MDPEPLRLVLALEPGQRSALLDGRPSAGGITILPVRSPEDWRNVRLSRMDGLLCMEGLSWADPHRLAQEARREAPHLWIGLLQAQPAHNHHHLRGAFDAVLPAELTLDDLSAHLPSSGPPHTPWLRAVRPVLEGQNVEQALQGLLDGLDTILTSHMAGIYWLEEDGRLHLRLLRTVDRHLLETLQRFPIQLGEGIAGRVAQSGRSLLVNHAERDPRSVYPGPPPACEHLIAIPLSLEAQVVGVLMIARHQDPPFSEEEYRLAELFVGHMNLAVENAYLLEATRHHAAELDRSHRLLRTLNHIAVHVTSAEAPEQVLQALGDDLQALGISILLLRYLPEEDALRLDYVSAPPEVQERLRPLVQADLAGMRFPAGRWPHFQDVIQHDRPTFGAPHAHDLQRLFPHLTPAALEQLIQIARLGEDMRMVQMPLRADERPLGVLVLWGDKIYPQDVPIFRSFASHVALALKRAEQLAHERQRVQQLDALRAALMDISSHLEPPVVMERILERGIALLDADAGEISLLQPDTQTLEVVASRGLGEDFRGKRIPLGLGAMGQAALRGEALLVNDYPHWEHHLPAYRRHIQALVTAPLLRGGRVVGTLSIITTTSRRRFSEQDRHLLALYAHQAAIVMENARLFHETRQLSLTDELTGLPNRRQLFQVGRRELRRALRFERPLSVIFFDLDHFKQVNDSFGHPIGDQVLHGVAQRCLHSIREVDLLGRYGGEEFVVLLPETRLEQAVQIAERLRQTVARTPFPTLAGEVPITISLGVAELQPGVTSLDVLLQQADQALYQAKQSGRNRVCVYHPTPEHDEGS